MSATPAPLLSVRGITKRFDGVRALAGIDLDLSPGEVLAVVGENGAGKSTLMKIVAGVLAPDAGTLAIGGRAVSYRGVADAQAAGVALIPQERNLADNLDVAANVLLGREIHRFGLVDRAAMRREAARHLAAVGLAVDPDTPTDRLSPGQQQMVEVAAALSRSARVLIMDEPTSSLSAAESERLLELIGELKGAGVSVLYISHRLGEVAAVADRALVLRDGAVVGELARDQIDHDRLLRLMVGRDVVRRGRRAAAARDGIAALAVRGLCTAEHPRHSLDLSVWPGEVVGLAGLVGAGRSELLRALFGVTPPRGGEVLLDDRPLPPGGPPERLASGLAYVPEERQREGLLLEMTLRENVSLSTLADEARAGLIDRRAERTRASSARDDFGIRAPDIEAPVSSLSGGNQQKVVLARALGTTPRVLLLDEPTRGVDVAAKDEIHRLVDGLAAEGVAVLFASSEMEELLELADRVLVMRQGALVGELTGDDLTEEAVGALATGGPGGRKRVTT